MIEVIKVLMGCTSLSQPVDVKSNKSVKAKMQERWEDLMLERDSIVNGTVKEPSRKLAAPSSSKFMKHST